MITRNLPSVQLYSLNVIYQYESKDIEMIKIICSRGKQISYKGGTVHSVYKTVRHDKMMLNLNNVKRIQQQMNVNNKKKKMILRHRKTFFLRFTYFSPLLIHCENHSNTHAIY